MCGIAGIVDLRGEREPDTAALARMAAAIEHRGPDEDGFFHGPNVGLASRRLSIIGLADGRQPIANEDGSVVVVFNGELFDYREQREELRRRGHVFRTSSDTEILVHLWEEHGEELFQHLRGQFAFALYDRRRRTLVLARDRVGICPLHWSRQNDWLVFGSEIKSLLASGLVPAEADARGLDQVFTFFALPGRRTVFKDVWSLGPGRYLKVAMGPPGELATVSEHTYWDLNFPDRGDEYDPADEEALVDEFQATFARAVELRLRADVPVVSYLSGGVDSAAVLATASNARGSPVPSFTIRIASPRLDETSKAMVAAQSIGSTPTVVTCDAATLSATYPQLVQAADCPVVDTSCAALYCLAAEVHRQGFKVALTGEGADEALAGYVWFKVQRALRYLNVGPLRPSTLFSHAFRRLMTPTAGLTEFKTADALLGGSQAQSEMYHLASVSRRRFYSSQMWQRLAGHTAYEDLDLDLERMARWHPLNQSLYVGYKTILPGLLLNHKGDRVAMANSVETRYPFLDEEVIALCARVHPRWKLRGLRRDKHLLRRAAVRYLPAEIASRPKAMFRAPFAATLFTNAQPWVRQLMSVESLTKTPYFDPAQVRRHYEACTGPARGTELRMFVEMGLTTVLATQLWHHLYLGGGLCELPPWSAPTHDPAASN